MEAIIIPGPERTGAITEDTIDRRREIVSTDTTGTPAEQMPRMAAGLRYIQIARVIFISVLNRTAIGSKGRTGPGHQ
jgi:hypothetical protein